MTRDELDRLWSRSENWGLMYRCPTDPRVIVPKRWRALGWTINFAHPWAWPALLLCVAVAIGPVVVLRGLGVTSVPLLLSVLGASICALAVLSHWEATRPRP